MGEKKMRILVSGLILISILSVLAVEPPAQILLQGEDVWFADTQHFMHKASEAELTQYAAEIQAVKDARYVGTVRAATIQIKAGQILQADKHWTSMTNQLANYDAHYIDATNKIEQVTDAKTKTALTKSLKATDDCHDALVKLIKCFRDYVQGQTP